MEKERHLQDPGRANTEISYPSPEDIDADACQDVRGNPNRDCAEDKRRGVPS